MGLNSQSLAKRSNTDMSENPRTPKCKIDTSAPSKNAKYPHPQRRTLWACRVFLQKEPRNPQAKCGRKSSRHSTCFSGKKRESPDTFLQVDQRRFSREHHQNVVHSQLKLSHACAWPASGGRHQELEGLAAESSRPQACSRSGKPQGCQLILTS